MSSLAQIQSDFLSFILSGGKNIFSDINETARANKDIRLGVYYDAYRIRFREILMEDYEKLHTLVGDDYFEEIVEAYTANQPSSDPNARYISQALPQFLEENAPFNECAFLAEMARFEWVLSETIDAADAPILTLADLQSVQPAHFPSVVFQCHPAVRQLTLKWNMPAIWQAMASDDEPCEPTPYDIPVTWLLWREPSGLQSTFCSLTTAENSVLQGIQQNLPFGTLCENLITHLPPDEIPVFVTQLLQRWVCEGIFTALY